MTKRLILIALGCLLIAGFIVQFPSSEPTAEPLLSAASHNPYNELFGAIEVESNRKVAACGAAEGAPINPTLVRPRLTDRATMDYEQWTSEYGLGVVDSFTALDAARSLATADISAGCRAEGEISIPLIDSLLLLSEVWETEWIFRVADMQEDFDLAVKEWNACMERLGHPLQSTPSDAATTVRTELVRAASDVESPLDDREIDRVTNFEFDYATHNLTCRSESGYQTIYDDISPRIAGFIVNDFATERAEVLALIEPEVAL